MMLRPLNVGLTLNSFANVTCSVFNIAAEESILKLDIFFAEYHSIKVFYQSIDWLLCATT